MGKQQVLYEAKLAKVGKRISWAGAAVLLVCIAGGFGLFLHGDYFPIIIIGIAAVYFFVVVLRGIRLRRNPGVYRVSIDDFGLYVHSDDQESAPSFTVIATDLYRLIRKTVKQVESPDEHEYYVETKSGVRHRIEQLFVNLDLDAMELFKKIADRFHWVEIHEETN